MTIETLGTIIAPIAAIVGATAWLHASLSALREQIAGMRRDIDHLNGEVNRLRDQKGKPL
jgi:hypothetical protein